MRLKQLTAAWNFVMQGPAEGRMCPISAVARGRIFLGELNDLLLFFKKGITYVMGVFFCEEQQLILAVHFE